jgi:hypothetical protein
MSKKELHENQDIGVSLPFRFLDVHTELRLAICRYALRYSFPVSFRDYTIAAAMQDNGQVAIHLVRTCKQLNKEGSELFYGQKQSRSAKTTTSLTLLMSSL